MPTYITLTHYTLSACSHDVGGNNSLIILPPGDLTQVQQVPNDRNQEPILLLFQHGSTD